MQKTVGRNRALESSLSEILKVQKSKGKHYSKAHRELVMEGILQYAHANETDGIFLSN